MQIIEEVPFNRFNVRMRVVMPHGCDYMEYIPQRPLLEVYFMINGHRFKVVVPLPGQVELEHFGDAMKERDFVALKRHLKMQIVEALVEHFDDVLSYSADETLSRALNEIIQTYSTHRAATGEEDNDNGN